MEFEDTFSIDDDTVCTICQAEFLDIDDLQLHVKQYHLNESNLSRYCPFCMEILPDLQSLALHMRNKHFSSTQSCKFCTRVFIDAEILSKHEKNHRHSELYPKISCSHCINIFNNKNELETHEFQEHRYQDYSMMLQEAFPMLSSVLNMNIRLFLQSTHRNQLYVCIICNMSTSDVTSYIQHILKENKNSYACDICYNVYDTKTKMSKHCVKHGFPFSVQNSVQQQCERCNKFFTGNKSKIKHLRKCMDMQCSSCSLTFNSVTEFSIHMASHSIEKTVPLHICKYCQRPLVGVDTLERHIERQHKHEMHLYKYHCKYCDKIFKHPKRLFGHFFTQHKELQPYICKICNKSFRIRRNFTLHIKLDHKSVGFVEFDGQFHVYFTDKRSQKAKEIKVSENAEVDNNIFGVLKADVRETNRKQNESGVEKINLNESIDDSTDFETTNLDGKENENNQDKSENIENIDDEITSDKKPEENNKPNILKIVADIQANESESESNDVKSTKQSKRKCETDYESEISSDNSDMPLLKVMKNKTLKNRKRKRKIQRSQQKSSSASKSFICKKCDRNCYTYQNYHRHLALHMKNIRKICIKCHGKFKSESELKSHIDKEHSSSKLTETLKKILERKKNNQDSIDKSFDSNETETESVRNRPTSDRFRRTIKKANIEKSHATVTITQIEKDKLSAKKFIENFMPENQEINSRITISNSLSIKPVVCEKNPPFIKLTKFTPQPEMNERPKLRKPVKFKDVETEEYNVSIKVVDKLSKSGFNLISTEVMNTDDSCYDVQEVEAPSSNNIPEVGREVMLDGVVEIPTPMQRTIVINGTLPTDNIRIGHLWPQAPFFKIVKINEVVKEVPKNEEPAIEKQPNITLPNGTKLVNVNPLSHLLGDRNIHEVSRAKSKYCYYKPKVRNFGEALVKALTGLEKTPYARKKANILRRKRKSE